ncbi:MAG: cadherin-like domain-containing protein, partial [Candidatus Thermoplasmatota archaeon]|nr:cadherin-like domain-containing protein [Candidatus Thermoplasmatota archaeon]
DNSSKNFARSMNSDKLKNQIVLSKAFDIVNGSLRAYIRSNYIYPDEKVSSRFHLLGTRSTNPTYTTDIIMALGFNNGGLAVLSTGNWYQLTKNVLPNTWYRIDLDWNCYDHEFDIKVTSMNGTLLASMEDLNFRNELGSALRFSLTTGLKITSLSHMETCIDDVLLKDINLLRTNTIVSQPIILPLGSKWTTLRIDHVNADGAYSEFELLGSEGRSLMNLFVGSDQCESELGYLNNEGIRELRFGYSCSVNGFTSPVLKGWGLEWESEQTWKDSFLTQKRTNGNTSAHFITGTYTLDGNSLKGSVQSRIIVRPDQNYWSTFEYDGYSDDGCSVSVDLLDGLTGSPITPFIALSPGSYDISSISYDEHQYLIMRANLTSNGSIPVLRSWSLRWSGNNGPEVVLVSGPKEVRRSYPCTISVTAKDPERDASTLSVHLTYSEPGSNETLASELEGPAFNSSKVTWDYIFVPSENALLGMYSFTASCSDEVGADSQSIRFHDVVEVMNNPPMAPVFELIPRNPTTTDEVRSIVSIKASDRENDPLTFTYSWFLNGKELKTYSAINNSRFSPTLPADVHRKGDVIKLDVKVNDGKDWSESSINQVVIMNSPTKLVLNYPASITMFEDNTDYRQLDLSKFFIDEDNDPLTFGSRSLVNSDIDVAPNGSVSIIPEPDWHGMERMVFNASDGSTIATLGMDLIVQSVNDLPTARLVSPSTGSVYVKVGEGLVLRGEGSDKDMDDLTFTWKDGDVHLGAGDRITLNWSSPGARTIDCHVSDGYVDIVYSRVVVNVTKRPVIPGSNESGTGNERSDRNSDDKLAFYLLPVIAMALLVVIVALAFIIARKRSRDVSSAPIPEPAIDDRSAFSQGDENLVGDLSILGLEPVPIDEGLPEHEVEALPPSALEEGMDADMFRTNEDTIVGSEQAEGEIIDNGPQVHRPNMENIDLEAELNNIEMTLNGMFGEGPAGDGTVPSEEDPLLPSL